MIYNYRGRTVTIDDKIITTYRQAWCGLGPSTSTFDRYLSCEFKSDDIDSRIKNMSDSEIAQILTAWLIAETEGNK